MHKPARARLTTKVAGPAIGSRHTIFEAVCIASEGKEGQHQDQPCVLKRFSTAALGSEGAGAGALRAFRKACHIMCSVVHPNVIPLQVEPRAIPRGQGAICMQTGHVCNNMALLLEVQSLPA